jgi:multidrug efflux pump subunit AcrB
MDKGLTYLTLKNKRFSIFLVVIVLVLGFFNYSIMPRQEVADVSPPLAQVIAVYPGGSPETIERLITSEIESEVSEIKGYDRSNSISKEGISIVNVFLEDSANPEKSWIDLNEKIDDLQGIMPEGTRPIQVNTDIGDTAGMIIALSGKGYSYEVLADYARHIQDNLIGIDGVESFEIVGDLEKKIEVEVNQEKLNTTNLTLNKISNLLKAQNIKIPAGYLESDDFKIKVNTDGDYQNLENIENTIISVSPMNQSVLRLKDIAKVSYVFDDSSPRYRQGGSETVLLAGYFKESLNIVTVGESVEEELSRLENNLPKELKLTKVTFQPTEVEESIRAFIINLLQAIGFVILVVLIGMGFKNALIVSTTIPFSIALTFIVMNFLGIKLEQMSITALIIALGMLVDNSIVVIDAIQYHINKGVEPFKAAIKGSKEVAFAMLTSSLTTIIAFAPLLFIQSAIGDYLFGIPSVVIIALLASYMCAQLITPLMASMFLKPAEDKNLKLFEFKKYFKSAFKWSANHQIIVSLVIIVSIAMTGLMVGSIQKSMFPKASKPIFYINIESETMGNIDATEDIVEGIETILADEKYVEETISALGDGLPKFYMTVLPVTPAEDTGQILVKVKEDLFNEYKTLQEYAETVQEKLNNQVTGASVQVRLLDMGTSNEQPIQVRVSTESLDTLRSVSTEITNELASYNDTARVNNSFANQVYELKVNVDSDEASLSYITSMDIQRSVNQALKGVKSTTLETDRNEYDVFIKSDIDNKKALENLMIQSSASNNKVMLKSIARVDLVQVYPQIERLNGKRVAEITADVQPGVNPQVIEDEIRTFIEKQEYQNIFLDYDGEMAKVMESFTDLGKYAVIALLFIFALLVLQFNSFLQPVIIFISIILSFIGGISGLYLSGQPLSFTALLGLVSLMGIVVNNAIVLVDFMNQTRDANSDSSILSICEESIDRRFRPIILSTTTTIIGLTPLLLTGGELFRPLATVIMSGLALATVLTLVIVPTIYFKMNVEKA